MALLLLCRGTWLIELVKTLGLRPPLCFFRRHSRSTWYDLCYRRTVIVDVHVISYECSVCSMPIEVIGNALTIVFFYQSIYCFFAPFEEGIYPGITRTRDFCEFCTTLPVPGTSVSSVRHSYCTRTRTFYFRYVSRVNHTRGVYPRYYPTKNFCNFCRTLIPVPGTSGSSVRRCH